MNSPKYDIQVSADTAYLEAQSEPAARRYAFSYTITIANHGSIAAQLLSRHWLITDANGRIQEVHGDGVVGTAGRGAASADAAGSVAGSAD